AHYNPVITALATMPKPVIAAVNGTCAGAGLGLALACDLRIAAAGIRYTTAFTGIGLTPDSGLSAALSRALGTARASELILLADPFTAEDAFSWGLVGRVVPGPGLRHRQAGHPRGLGRALARRPGRRIPRPGHPRCDPGPPKRRRGLPGQTPSRVHRPRLATRTRRFRGNAWLTGSRAAPRRVHVASPSRHTATPGHSGLRRVGDGRHPPPGSPCRPWYSMMRPPGFRVVTWPKAGQRRGCCSHVETAT